MRVGGPTVEHRADPLGVDAARPLLGWIVAAPGAQTGYRLEVSTTADGHADVWDSGRVTSAQSFLGATTMWEEWDAGSRSHDHAFLGTVDDWLHQSVAGIEPAAPGYARITVRPTPVGDLRHASAHVDSPRGTIFSSWRRTPKSFVLEVAIPAGAIATVHVPADRRGDVTRPPGATFIGMNGANATFTVPSGHHTFSAAIRR
ncbi:hypothetical protein COUCH_15740 [Couchioplanes caeruleus]|uniref:alpha-L-rhamnosidase C-terminal domain-containing protein n=1 Tax=Couchioplanes caeruleus TaxID=56438 RepID=UPI0020C0C1F1|nr:alpha-L-rhamnosidase C-terminal domain-containing protein [Couchioplanes caeruleus]UQU67632.1 hypothetical protein COUCH_15740 [Couchioplanes caeruleus]